MVLFLSSELGMLGSPGLDHLSNGSDLKYSTADCYSPKLFSNDPRDYKGETYTVKKRMRSHGLVV